jgi:hypothetical protein
LLRCTPDPGGASAACACCCAHRVSFYVVGGSGPSLQHAH